VLFIIGLKKEKTALKEAKDSHTPVLAICNTSGDPDLIDYVILGSDWNKKSVSYLVNAVAEIIRKSKLKKSGDVPEPETSTKEENN
jgi:small subunit ribosomal protein S2